jgi:hypothetical protein
MRGWYSRRFEMGARIGSYFADGVGRIVSFIPQLVSAAIILAVGYGIAVLIRFATRRLLQGAKFDRFVERRVHHRATSKGSPSVGAGAVAFWIVMLAAFAMASRALGLDTLSAGLSRILGYIPHVLVACVIVAVGAAVGRLIGELVGEVSSRSLGNLARGAVIVLTVFMALDELKVAHGIVLTTFTLLLGAAAVAAAIAFGLGNRTLADEYTRRWVRRTELESSESKLARRTEDRPPLEPLPPELRH